MESSRTISPYDVDEAATTINRLFYSPKNPNSSEAASRVLMRCVLVLVLVRKRRLLRLDLLLHRPAADGAGIVLLQPRRNALAVEEVAAR